MLLRRMRKKKMIIDCVSDLHGYYPELGGGDLLIVAGDLTGRDTHLEYLKFYHWLHNQKYSHYIFIGGNHDNLLQTEDVISDCLANTTYLCDSGTEFDGLKIWGSPWTKNFKGQNPHCKAFGVDTEEELAVKWDLIPEDTDILVTHSPPLGILDTVQHDRNFGRRVGSESLHNVLYTRKIKPKLHVFGHIHGSYGHIPLMDDMPGCQFVNASHVNEYYEPVNKPIRIEL